MKFGSRFDGEAVIALDQRAMGPLVHRGRVGHRTFAAVF
jgi:hypothetical protein